MNKFAGLFKRQRWRASAAALAVAGAYLFLPACGLEPSGGQPKKVAGVTLFLEHQSLGLVRDAVKTCLIEVRPVVDGELGAIEGGGHEYAVQGEAERSEFGIGGLTLGRKEFKAILFNGDRQILGMGTIQHDVRPGSQTLSPIVIKLVSRPDEKRTVLVEAQVTARMSEVPVTYLDVQPIFAADCATFCHSAAMAMKGLNLEAFPFVSTSPILGNDQRKIVSSIISWMSDEVKPMPPVPPPQQGTNIALIQRWLDGGLAVGPTGPADSVISAVKLNWKASSEDSWHSLNLVQDGNLYKGEIADVKIGDTCEFKFSVFGPQDMLLHEEPKIDKHIEPQGALQFNVNFDYQAPNVRIPIVIEP